MFLLALVLIIDTVWRLCVQNVVVNLPMLWLYAVEERLRQFKHNVTFRLSIAVHHSSSSVALVRYGCVPEMEVFFMKRHP